MKRRVLLLVLGVLALLGISAAILSIAVNAPDVSRVQPGVCVLADGGTCLLFPTVTGVNLLGDTLTLPDDFEGAYNLVIVSFDEGQTARAKDWLPLAQELAGQHTGFAYYSVATLGAVNPLARAVIVGGMVALVPDERLRARTVMLFLEDKPAFLDALAIPDLEAIQVFLLDERGAALWRASGDYSEARGAALRAALEGR